MGLFGSSKGGPTEEELKKIESEEGVDELDLTNKGIEKLVKETMEDVVNIDNSGKTFCESATELDGYASSDKSQLDNADKLGNTASPFSFFSKK